MQITSQFAYKPFCLFNALFRSAHSTCVVAHTAVQYTFVVSTEHLQQTITLNTVLFSLVLLTISLSNSFSLSFCVCTCVYVYCFCHSLTCLLFCTVEQYTHRVVTVLLLLTAVLSTPSHHSPSLSLSLTLPLLAARCW